MNPEFIYIDLFCGAGGTTTGITMAVNERKTELIAIVAACVNHDAEAIKSHWANHPEVEHFEEDIRTLDLTRLVRLVNAYRAFYPDAKVVLWASLECTNFSKAKGGQPRDADSRTLADHLDRYVLALEPDYVQIENVVEFMSWGPLDDNGKPISRRNGEDWMRWRERLCGYGYRDEWRELNSANFGAYTSRNRLFGVFAKDDMPIVWPEPTHAKKVLDGMFGMLKPWKAVKEVLDFSDEGNSIFSRKKELSDKTLERIYAGLIKFVAGGKENFIAKTFSGRPEGKVISTDGPAGTITCFGGQNLVKASFISKYNGGKPGSRNTDVNEPLRTITTENRHAVVNAAFLSKQYSGSPDDKNIAVTGPAGTVTCVDHHALVNAKFIHAYYGNGDNNHSVNGPCPTIPTKDRCVLVSANYLISYQHSSSAESIDRPCPTIMTKDRYSIVHPKFIMRDFTREPNVQSVESPAGSLTTIPKMNLVTAEQAFVMGTNYDNKPTSLDSPLPTITANRKWHYLVNPAWGGNMSTTEQPCPVVVARQDKAPLYLVISEGGDIAIRLEEGEPEIMVKIKEFMVLYGIVDIKMRMLKVAELLRIQGFPAGYKLTGTQSDQKKFIGNSVVPHVVKAWVEAMYTKTRLIKMAA